MKRLQLICAWREVIQVLGTVGEWVRVALAGVVVVVREGSLGSVS